MKFERLTFDGPCLYAACEKTHAHSHHVCPHCGAADVGDGAVDPCISLASLPPTLRAQVEVHLRERATPSLDS